MTVRLLSQQLLEDGDVTTTMVQHLLAVVPMKK